MKKTMCQAAMAAALLSLVGCGLKGPIYFPPEQKPAKPQQQVAKPATAQSDTSASTDGGTDVKASQ